MARKAVLKKVGSAGRSITNLTQKTLCKKSDILYSFMFGLISKVAVLVRHSLHYLQHSMLVRPVYFYPFEVVFYGKTLNTTLGFQ